MKYTSKFFMLVGFSAVSSLVLAQSGAEEQVKKALEKASKAEKLPQSAAVVVFGEKEAVVLADNPRWVIKGKLFDMWQNKEINGPLALRDADKRIPINKIKVNTKDVIEARVRPEKELIVTVFLDPFMGNSSEVVRVLNTYATDYQVRYIYTSMSQANIQPFLSFSCQSRVMDARDISQMIIDKNFIETSESCRQTEAMNSFGLTQFLHINQSPTIIAPNDVYHIGLPSALMRWLKDNEI
ncbi:thioredoxin domain-containing protein [Vibrio cholerae]|uniref:hypothetical protein n=1 Tax=Vibrio cholerae TaxID=666 RepID=UPI0011DB71E0|nr:hypothetical protein [Vibrio cholerae]TXY52051.1 hypothetical protein FXE74_18885 [Vibrio cholerae]GIB31875.1 disulfide isomerase [Vibrio cholerae]